MTAKIATDMTLADLLKWQAETAGMKALVAADEKALQAELARRYAADHAASLARTGKTAGTITSVLEGGLRLQADTPKGSVKWDQAKLWAVAADLTREQLEHYCKIELTPKEAVYKALEPGSNMLGALKDARTDSAPGAPKFKLLAEGEK
jgi:hypothetical protein